MCERGLVSVAHQRAPAQCVGEVCRLHGIELRERRSLAERRRRVEHGQRAREVDRAVRQPLELERHGARDLLWPERRQLLRSAVRRLRILRRELRDERAEQERVAAAGRVACLGERRRRVGEGGTDERFRRGRAERARPDGRACGRQQLGE